MKILCLRFRNIHSLKGNHQIDFTKPPLSNAGLFAITGPTGAGKSTILDVITLALFNKIPRFATKGTESISKTDIEKTGSVMTHFTDDAYAEIEYECKNIIYRSRWSISRARTGNLRDYEMELATVSDKNLFDLKKSEVPSKNEEILGLKYDQFIRSIVLSQGDFARFLKSDDKERARLLENITDSRIYREIGIRVFEKARSYEDELKNLRLQSGMISRLTDEIVIEKQGALLQNATKLNKLNTEIEIQAQLLSLMEKKAIFLYRQAEAQTLLTDLVHKKQSFQNDEIRLQKHKNLDTYRGRLVLWQNERDRIIVLENDLASNVKTSGKAEIILQQALTQMAEFTHSTITVDNFMSQMKAFENKIIDYDNQLSNLEKTGKSWRERYNNLIEKRSSPEWQVIKLAQNWEARYEHAISLKESLDNVAITFVGTEIELNAHMHQLQQQAVAQMALFKDVQMMELLVLENEKFQTQSTENEKEWKTLNQRSTETEEKLAEVKKSLEQAKDLKQQWLKIATLDDHRHELIDGEPCPLCGALDHPYATNLPFKIGENEILINNLTIELQTVEKLLQGIKTSATTIATTNLNIKARIQENLSKIIAIREAHIQNTMSSIEISKDIERIKVELETCKHELVVRQDKDLIGELMTTVEELKVITTSYLNIKGMRMGLYQGNDINGDADKIQNAFVAARESLQNLNVTIENIKKEKVGTLQKWENMTTILKDELNVLGYGNPIDALADILPDEILRDYQNKKDILVKEETELNAAIRQLDVDLAMLKDIDADANLIAEAKASLEKLNKEKDELHVLTGAIRNELKNHEEQVVKFRELTTTIAKVEKAATPVLHLNHLIGDAQGNRYAKFAQNLSLRHLINLANVRLEKLSDRYTMAVTDIEDDLKIIDHYQGQITRSVKTLSGGETFIISLAMALSLSDMASKNVRLDSLFIDEGFGTLDPETMEVALVTLEKLQSEGNRMIGIISHVESLKERIATQIKVVKSNQGYSTIEIV